MKKINLLIDEKDSVLNGYINIDPFADGTDSRIQGDISNLDHLVDDAEADEIIAKDIIGFFEINRVDSIIDNWLKKLAKGGKLILYFLDLESCVQAYIEGKINHEQLNRLVYGDQNKAWNFRNNSLFLIESCDIFKNKGYKILKSSIVNDFYGMIVCQRV